MRRPRPTAPALVHDVTSPAERVVLNLARPVAGVVPTPRAPRAHGSATILLDGTGGKRPSVAGALWRSLRRKNRARDRARVRHLPPQSILLDFSQRAEPSPVRVAHGPLPALLALVLVMGGTLAGVVGVELHALAERVQGGISSALAESRAGLASLQAVDPANAASHFRSASTLLAESESLLAEASAFSELAALSPAERSRALLIAARHTAQAGASASHALASIDANDLPTALEEIGVLLASLRDADAAFAVASADDIPADVQPIVQEVRRLALLTESVRTQYPLLLRAFGSDGPRRYLILFQNTAERRGAGGFLGSFALLEVDALAVKRFAFHDVYDIDWKLHAAIPPPEGLAPFYGTMRLRDSNYAADFPEAALWIEQFYELSGGTTVDGILSVDAEFFGALLDVLGPLPMPESDLTLTRENYQDLLTTRIETSKDDPAGDKDVIRTLLPVVTERLLDRALWPKLLPLLERSIAEKHVYATADDPELQDVLARFTATGALPEPLSDTDELLVVSTNVGGNKSDRFTTLRAHHIAHVRTDGSVGVTIALEKEFALPADFEQRVAPLLAGKSAKETAYLRHVLGDSQNRDYLRVFLPRGTSVRTVTGVAPEQWHVREESGRTVLGLQLDTNVGETSRVAIEADLPMRIDFVANATYRFRALKQLGAERLSVRHEVRVDPGLTILGTTNDQLDLDLSGTTDTSHAAVITRIERP